MTAQEQEERSSGRPSVRAVGVEGHGAREQRCRGHPIAEPGRTGGSVGSPGRPAHYREAPDPSESVS